MSSAARIHEALETAGTGLTRARSGSSARRQSALPRRPTRRRRKLVRFSGGSASCRRISSTSARSLSRRSAARRVLRATGLFIGALQDVENGKVPRTTCRFLAPDDIRQRCDSQRGRSQRDAHRTIAKPGERSNAMNRGQKVDLEPVVAHNAEKIGGRIVRSQDSCTEGRCQRFQLPPVNGRIPKHEVKIEGGDRSTLKGGRRIADQNGVEMKGLEQSRNFGQERFGVHPREYTGSGSPPRGLNTKSTFWRRPRPRLRS